MATTHADWNLDRGLGAGHDGGQSVFEGAPANGFWRDQHDNEKSVGMLANEEGSIAGVDKITKKSLGCSSWKKDRTPQSG